MRIAFDLDNTLVPCGKADFAVERTAPRPLCPLARLWLGDGLRCGARALLHELRRQGHEIWIYTTSSRSPLTLRLWFLLQGIPLGGVVNWRRHDDLVHTGQCPNCSKYPPAFGIDLLVDSRDGVALEGLQYGFEVLLVPPCDPDWTERILATTAAASVLMNAVTA